MDYNVSVVNKNNLQNLHKNEDFERNKMLAETLFDLFKVEGYSADSVNVLGQVIESDGQYFIWADGLDIEKPVILPIPDRDGGVTKYIDTIKNYFFEHRQLVKEILEAARYLDLQPSITLIARTVEIMKDDENIDSHEALNISMTWSQLILDLYRLSLWKVGRQ